jgi:hypothetical protein
MSQESEGTNSPRRKNVTIARIKIIAYSMLFLGMLAFIIAIFVDRIFFSLSS